MSPGLFRYLLALIVFVHHLSHVALGNMAVYLFFVLSGYWIASVWTARYAGSRTPLTTFFLSRWLRLAPVFVLVNVLAVLVWMQLGNAAVVASLRDNPVQALLSNLLILGYASLPSPALVPGWSLDVEMQFYLAAPFLIALARRWPALTLAAGAILTVGAFAIFGPNLPVAGRFLPTYFLWFALGMVAAVAGWTASVRLGQLSLGLGIGGILLAAWLLPADLHDGGATLNVGLALVFTPFALSTVRNPSGPFDASFGDMSYILYLLHWPAVAILGVARDRLPASGTPLLAALAIALTVTATYAIWRWFDRPLNRWRASLIEPRLRS